MIRLLHRVGLPLLMCSLLLAPHTRAGDASACAVEEDVTRLVELVHQRLMLADDVARYKWNHKLAIEDLPREQVIIDSLSHRAAAAGMPQQLAEAFFLAQIEASKAEQRALFERWHRAGNGEFRNTPDLIAEIRPQLDALTPKMIDVLSRLWPHFDDPYCMQLIAVRVQERHHEPEWHYPRALRIATASIAEVAAID